MTVLIYWMETSYSFSMGTDICITNRQIYLYFYKLWEKIMERINKGLGFCATSKKFADKIYSEIYK